MSDQPDTSTIAINLSDAIERASQTRDPSEIIRLLAANAVWRSNDTVHVGRGEIWSALSEHWANSLHCTTQQVIESCDSGIDVIQIQSEWQHSINGGWYRTTAELRVRLNEGAKISTIESRHSYSPISLDHRRMSIATTSTPKPST